MNGTLMPQASIDKSPSSKTIEILNSLCRDKNNMVFIVSGRSRDKLAEWFFPCENLGIAAEHGYFIRYAHFPFFFMWSVLCFDTK